VTDLRGKLEISDRSITTSQNFKKCLAKMSFNITNLTFAWVLFCDEISELELFCENTPIKTLEYTVRYQHFNISVHCDYCG
jgi:hypothetical protein